jgi:hypothetical protein
VNVRLIGPEGADPGAALAELSGPAKDKLLLAVLRRRTLLIRKAAVAALAAQGIGRAIWGRDATGGGGSRRGPAGAMKFITGRVRLKDHVFSGEIVDKGIASMMETGGDRTKDHTIAPKHADRLAFITKSDGLRYASGPVHHPGGRVPKQPHTAPAIDSQAADLARDIDSVMSGFIERATSKGRR